MSQIYLAVLALMLCYVQCMPVETESKTASENALHLFVNNSTKSVNYHLSSIMTELEDIDDEIAKELDTVLPYINFLFDALFGRSDDDEEDDDCVNDMIIQLVPDDTTEHQEIPTEPQETPTETPTEEPAKEPAAEPAKEPAAEPVAA